ncbi:MAG TPA: ABC transporter ATP-binding protein [Cellulomonas sp.]
MTSTTGTGADVQGGAGSGTRPVAPAVSPAPGAAAHGPAAPRPDALVSVRDLHVRFTGSRPVHAVRGVSFDLAPGEAVAIVGESGSGKSVTSRSLVGLAGPGAVVEADGLTVLGRDARRLGERDWRRIRGARVGLVLQDALTSLDPLRTVGGEVAETLAEHRLVPRRRRRERVRELLAAVGVPDPEVRAAQYPHQLSGGLRQRALIASALAGDPALLIADEPTTALDVTVQAQILALLEARRSAGTALLLVSHDLAVVARIADRVLVMHDGVLLEQGPTAEVLADPQHEYTRSLLAAIPSAATRGRRLSGPDRGAVVVRPRAQAPTGPSATSVGPARPPEPDGAAPGTAAPGTAAPGTAGAGTRPVLEAVGVSRSFALPRGGRRTAVDDVSLTLAPGQRLGVVGESGSGKSTLARLLLGLLPADSGAVRVLGEPWAAPGSGRSAGGADRRRAQRHAVQFVSQDPLGSFDPRYDVTELIGEPLRGVLPKAAADERVRELLDLVGLAPDVAGATPRRLSGGQRQRVSIARALALRPQVLLCDEPVSALDVSIQAQVLDLLADLTDRTGTALLFISHDLGVVHHLVDDVLVMRNGRVVESGDVDEVFLDPLHPYTQELVAAVPRLP